MIESVAVIIMIKSGGFVKEKAENNPSKKEDHSIMMKAEANPAEVFNFILILVFWISMKMITHSKSTINKLDN